MEYKLSNYYCWTSFSEFSQAISFSKKSSAAPVRQMILFCLIAFEHTLISSSRDEWSRIVIYCSFSCNSVRVKHFFSTFWLSIINEIISSAFSTKPHSIATFNVVIGLSPNQKLNITAINHKKYFNYYLILGWHNLKYTKIFVKNMYFKMGIIYSLNKIVLVYSPMKV